MRKTLSFISLPIFVVLLTASIFQLYPEINVLLPGQSVILVFINCLSSLFGLVFLGKLLRAYFHKIPVFVSLSLLLFGTNLFAYTTTISGFLHPISFFLISLFLYRVSTFSFSNRTLIELGVVYSLIVFINPLHFVLGLLALCFNAKSFNHLKNRIQRLIGSKGFVLSVVLFFVLTLLYVILNNTFRGSFFPVLSDDEQFFFNRPHVYAALLEYRKGWLIYTPLMFFSIIGLFNFYRRNIAGRYFFIAFTFLLVLVVYVHFSWWNWWYGDSFGQRVMIDYYPLLAVPLTAIVQAIYSSKSRILKFWGLVGAVFFIYLNIFQTFQYKSGILSKDSMSEELFWMVFGEKQKPSIYDCLLEHPDYRLAKEKGKIGFMSNDCKGTVIKPGKLKKYRPAGTYYGVEGAILFSKEEPVSIYYTTPIRASRFSVSLDENDIYLIEFYNKGELMKEVTLSNDDNKSGLYVYERQIENPGTDRVVIKAIQGDNVFSVGHFFFR